MADVIDLTELSDGSGEDNTESDGSDSGPELQDATASSHREMLKREVTSISESHLRRILATLIDTVPEVEKALARELLSVHRETRKAKPRWELCENCNEEYELDSERVPTECVFHPEGLEVDWESDCWVDWDERCHGTIDTEENQRTYPEGFTWSCCDKPGTNEEGCLVQQHEPSTSRKRRRL